MHTVGVMSVLEGSLNDEVRRLWRLFEVEYESRGAQIFAHPNVTVGGGRCREPQALVDGLKQLACQTPPFALRVRGFGRFREPDGVVFLRVLPTESLLAFHHDVDRLLERECEELFPHYRGCAWVPHITVGMGDLSGEAFERAWAELSHRDLEIEEVACDLTLAQSLEAESGFEIVCRCRLRGQPMDGSVQH